MRFLLCFLLLPLIYARATTYYVDSLGGSDSKDGLSPDRAWQTFARPNTKEFSPGDRLLLRAGSVWKGIILQPRGSGVPTNPIVIDRYGEGKPPLLEGEGRVPYVFRLENQEGWDVSNLEITNHSEKEGERLRGVEIYARDSGVRRALHFRNLCIHDVNAASTYTNDADSVAKSYGGFVAVIAGTLAPTMWSDFVVENCRFVDDGPMGLTMISSWVTGHVENDSATWCPSLGVIIRGCTFERIARNGLVVRGCRAPLIEYNLFTHCAIAGSGNASFAFHCDDAVFQFNEACYTRYNPGDADAAGFDSDYNCRRTIFQFNYSHDNDYGFILLCCNGAYGFNEGTIVRNNISQNDRGIAIRFSGPVRGARIYNNTVYCGPEMTNPRPGDPPKIVAHKSWGGWSNDNEFSNNIIVNLSERATYEFAKSTHNRYRHNLFFGLHPSTEPEDPRKLTDDPRFQSAGGASVRNGTAKEGVESAFAAYALKPGSPAAGMGATLLERK